MSANYYDLSIFDVAIAAALVLINGAISLVLKLRLERRLLLAAVRTIVQLTLIGFVFNAIFAQSHLATLGLLALVMTTIAGTSAVRRTGHRYPGIWWNSMAAVLAASWTVSAITLTSVIRFDGWADQPAQFVIPLLGMILGNTLNGISLGLDRFAEQLRVKRGEIEMHLALGANRFEAAEESIRDAVRTGMIPIINSMMVVGIVSLPGMMTGQLLAGVTPLAAIRYQIVIMFVIAAATGLGTIGVVLLGYRRLFNARHQFLYDEITRVE